MVSTKPSSEKRSGAVFGSSRSQSNSPANMKRRRAENGEQQSQDDIDYELDRGVHPFGVKVLSTLTIERRRKSVIWNEQVLRTHAD